MGEREEEIWESDGSAHYLDCGKGSRAYACVKTYQIVCFEYVQFIVSQVYFNKTAKVNGE